MGNSKRTVLVDAAKFRSFRRKKALRQEDFETHNISRKTISNIENGKPIQLATLREVAKALNISPEELLSDKEVRVISTKIQEHIRSFDFLIEERTREFHPNSRKFVFEAIETFIHNPDISSGYFIIKGEPGIGKTALLSQWIKKSGCRIYHFNSILDGINQPHHFWANICARLIVEYQLPYDDLPEGFDRDNTLFYKVLCQAGQRLHSDQRLVIAIDALDEIDSINYSLQSNILFLPPVLPPGVFVLATSRPLHDLKVQADSIHYFDFERHLSENLADIEEYVKEWVERDGIQKWMAGQKLSADNFVKYMVQKSTGNFMYLRYVLPAIECGDFKDDTIDSMPEGLRAYYRRHWNKMRSQFQDSFDRIHKLIICMFAAVVVPVPIQQISLWTEIEYDSILKVIQKWREFLHEELGQDNEHCFCVYHASFLEFLQSEVDPGLIETHTLISKSIQSRIKNAKRRKSQ